MPPFTLMRDPEPTQERDPRFIDYIPAVYLSSRNPQHAVGERRYVAIFDRYDGGDPVLTYVEYDGNEESLARLDVIAKENNDDEYWVKLLNLESPIPESAVNELRATGAESVRSALISHLPAPNPHGWNDCEEWSVSEVLHFKFDGQIALLPLHPPISFRPEWENYACHLFSFYLKDYIRPWQSRQ